MTKAEAIELLERSEDELRRTRATLAAGNLPVAKEHFTKALALLDNTCAIQLDNLN